MKDVESRLREQLEQRILIKDGAMGTMIQAEGLSEAQWRGERFADHPQDLKGNNDLLVLTQPELIVDIHDRFLAAGADVLGTTTFTSTATAQADYGTEDLARELGVRLAVDGPATAPVDADPERLGQIVANLVENALKYADERVTVGVSSENGTLELRVDDDGPGIDPGDLPHVFERLYTSRTAPGRKVGTGLGLAIVHELSAAMGGTTDVRALDGQGTRFVVRIPAAQ